MGTRNHRNRAPDVNDHTWVARPCCVANPIGWLFRGLQYLFRNVFTFILFDIRLEPCYHPLPSCHAVPMDKQWGNESLDNAGSWKG